ncbi:hypothetical protein BDW62DRAFT_106681 [Aspergillus aurantiobrunneus]
MYGRERSEGKQREREGEGRVVVVGGRGREGERPTGKRAIDSYQRFQGKGGTAREGKREAAPAAAATGCPPCWGMVRMVSYRLRTVILHSPCHWRQRNFGHLLLHFARKLAGKRPEFSSRKSPEWLSNSNSPVFACSCRFRGSCTRNTPLRHWACC